MVVVLAMEDRSEEREGGGGGATLRGAQLVVKVLEDGVVILVEVVGLAMDDEDVKREPEATRLIGQEG